MVWRAFAIQPGAYLASERWSRQEKKKKKGPTGLDLARLQ